jgi:hypothetical protein
MGSYTHLPPEIARRVCEDKGQHPGDHPEITSDEWMMAVRRGQEYKYEIIRKRARAIKAKRGEDVNTTCHTHKFREGNFVMLKDYTPAHKGEKKLQSKYRGPMRIIKAMATSLVVVPWTETLLDIGELNLHAEKFQKHYKGAACNPPIYYELVSIKNCKPYNGPVGECPEYDPDLVTRFLDDLKLEWEDCPPPTVIMSATRASDLGSLPSQDPSFRPENHPSLWENDSEDSDYPNNDVDPAHPPSLHPSIPSSESEADSQNEDGIDEDQPINPEPHQQSDEDQDPDQFNADVFNPNPGPIDSEEEHPRDPREWYDAAYDRPVVPAKEWEITPEKYSYDPELGYNPQLTPRTAATQIRRKSRIETTQTESRSPSLAQPLPRSQQEKGRRVLREQIKTQGTPPLRAPLDGVPTTPTLHQSQEKDRKELRKQIRTEGASPL